MSGLERSGRHGHRQVPSGLGPDREELFVDVVGAHCLAPADHPTGEPFVNRAMSRGRRRNARIGPRKDGLDATGFDPDAIDGQTVVAHDGSDRVGDLL